MHLDDIPRLLEIAATLKDAPHWTSEAYARALDPDATPSRIALAAEEAGAGILGFLVAALIPPQAELESIAVAKTVQRRGIARLLCVELFAMLKTIDITDILLEVRESNRPARALYASLGFIENGRRPGYYSDPQEDAILLYSPVPFTGSPPSSQTGQARQE